MRFHVEILALNSEVISRSNKSDYLVVEASSFQLDKIQNLNLIYLFYLTYQKIILNGMTTSQTTKLKLKIFNNQNEIIIP